jgi:hypothetical protein
VDKMSSNAGGTCSDHYVTIRMDVRTFPCYAAQRRFVTCPVGADSFTSSAAGPDALQQGLRDAELEASVIRCHR